MFNKVVIIILTVFFSHSLFAKASAPLLCKSLFFAQSQKLLKTDVDPDWAAQMSNREKNENEQTLMDLVKEHAGNIPGEFKHEHHNSNYSHEIPKREVKDQCLAGSCWIFAGTNMLEGSLRSKGILKHDFSFSQNYLYFFSLLERANVYFESQIKYVKKATLASDIRILMQMNKVSDGGMSSEFSYLVKKYGLVPNEAMPHTRSSQNSKLVLEVLNDYLLKKASEMWMYVDQFKGLDAHPDRYQVESGAKEGEMPDRMIQLEKKHIEALRAYKQDVLSGAFKILEAHLGTPPTQFEFSPVKTTKNGTYKALKPEVYTPREFVNEYVEFKADDYVTLTDISTKARNKTFQMNFPSNMARAHEGFKFLNSRAHRMVQLIQKTIDKGVPVYLIADFSGPISNQNGVMHPGVKNSKFLYMMNEKEAPKIDFKNKEDWLYHYKGFGNHAVIIDAYDRPVGKKLPIKFRIENSWGNENGDKGHYHTLWAKTV